MWGNTIDHRGDMRLDRGKINLWWRADDSHAGGAIGIIPGTSVYVAVGRGFDHLLARGETPNLAVLNTPHIWLPLAGLALLALLPTLYRQINPTSKKDQPHDPS